MLNCVYIHIPFCEKKCNYCSFCSFPLLKKKKEYLEALKKEIDFFYKNETIKTLYFGGGTPSLLDFLELKEIISCFSINSNTEITLELNPNKITRKKIKEFKRLGINRFSIGAQNFDDKILTLIGRNHTKKDIFRTIDLIKQENIDNISIDLIYGLPNQDEKQWIETLQIANNLEISHISLYGLKIEEGTYFYKFPPKNLPNLDVQANMYEIAIEKLKDNYIHYEFSNFAKKDKENKEKYFSNHNLNYWNCGYYYGFGLSASGYDKKGRYSNTLNFRDYILNPTSRKYEKLTKKEKIEEEIFLGLRKNEGINFEKINEKFEIDVYKMFKFEFDKNLKNKLMEYTPFGVKLTLKGILLSNEVLCDFV